MDGARRACAKGLVLLCCLAAPPGIAESQYAPGAVSPASHKEVIAAHKRKLLAAPHTMDAYGALVNELGSMEAYGQVEGWATRAIALDPAAAWCYDFRGYARNMLGKWEEALVDFETAGWLGSTYEGLAYEKGRALHFLGRYEEALAQYRGYLQGNRSDWEAALARHAMGTAHAHLGKDEAAAEMYAMALALEPDNALYHASLGTALQSIGEWKEALKRYQVATRLDAENSWYQELYQTLMAQAH